MDVRPLARASLRDAVMELIETALVDGQLQPGDRIVEMDIAARAGISRGPVREAIRQLVGEGILVSEPGRGTFVTRWSPRAVEEAYTLRSALERFAVEQALKCLTPADLDGLSAIVDQMDESAQKNDIRMLVRLDLQFHETLYRFSRHGLLQEALSQLGRRLHCLQAIDPGFVAFRDEIAADHKKLVDALSTGDPVLAGDAISQHILSIGAVVVEQVRKWSAG